MMTTLDMQDISIEFPGVKALQHVDFSMKSGEIRALIGANGAGKSTLMKVLSGAYTHYTGQVFLDGQLLDIQSPRDAKKYGIDIVYQEVDTALIPYLDVAENIMLDEMVNEMSGKALVSWKNLHKKAGETLARLNVNIDTRKRVNQLSLAEKQLVLIARAIVHERKFLILDEPTAPLSNRETAELFRIVRELSVNQGLGIIFISHRLPELFEICETISIMKDGKMITTETVSDLTQKKVIELMLGKSFNEEHQKHQVPIGNTYLKIDNLTDEAQFLKNVSLEVREHDIVGIAGLVGAGKTELCKAIFGENPLQSGTIYLKDKQVRNQSPTHAVKNGFALVPEERRKEGVLVDEPVYANLTAASLRKFTLPFSVLKPERERERARKIIASLGIKTPSENQKVALLSGGNQQKVAVGKWLLTDAEILIFDEPTKGVDVGAKGDIFDLITSLAEEGKGIIYASSELNEILNITDRIYVMYDGKIVKELKTQNTNEEEILFYSTGGR
nr:sugar ABC transporter ATP-binding protein [Planococcus donghaensis]